MVRFRVRLGSWLGLGLFCDAIEGSRPVELHATRPITDRVGRNPANHRQSRAGP